MYNALHSCVVSMNTHEYLRSAVQTYLFTFASTGFMSTLRWALKNVHSWQMPCAQLHVKHVHELCEISFLRPDRQSAINSVFCVLTAVCDNKGSIHVVVLSVKCVWRSYRRRLSPLTMCVVNNHHKEETSHTLWKTYLISRSSWSAKDNSIETCCEWHLRVRSRSRPLLTEWHQWVRSWSRPLLTVCLWWC